MMRVELQDTCSLHADATAAARSRGTYTHLSRRLNKKKRKKKEEKEKKKKGNDARHTLAWWHRRPLWCHLGDHAVVVALPDFAILAIQKGKAKDMVDCSVRWEPPEVTESTRSPLGGYTNLPSVRSCPLMVQLTGVTNQRSGGVLAAQVEEKQSKINKLGG